MLEKMDWMLIGIRNRFANYLDRLEKEEDGSMMVEMVAIIAIVVVVAGIFKTQLSGVVTAVFEKVKEFIGVQ